MERKQRKNKLLQSLNAEKHNHTDVDMDMNNGVLADEKTAKAEDSASEMHPYHKSPFFWIARRKV